MQKDVIYTAAVLGSLCSVGADKPGTVASVVSKLHELDTEIATLVAEEDKSGIDHTGGIDALIETAEEHVARLCLSHPVSLWFNDEISEHSKGRLRLEIPGTCWDVDAPLYLS